LIAKSEQRATYRPPWGSKPHLWLPPLNQPEKRYVH